MTVGTSAATEGTPFKFNHDINVCDTAGCVSSSIALSARRQTAQRSVACLAGAIRAAPPEVVAILPIVVVLIRAFDKHSLTPRADLLGACWSKNCVHVSGWWHSLRGKARDNLGRKICGDCGSLRWILEGVLQWPNPLPLLSYAGEHVRSGRVCESESILVGTSPHHFLHLR